MQYGGICCEIDLRHKCAVRNKATQAMWTTLAIDDTTETERDGKRPPASASDPLLGINVVRFGDANLEQVDRCLQTNAHVVPIARLQPPP